MKTDDFTYYEGMADALDHFEQYIDQVLKASKEYSRLRFGEGPELTERQFNRVQLSVRIIAKKTCEWLYQDYLSQQK